MTWKKKYLNTKKQNIRETKRRYSITGEAKRKLHFKIVWRNGGINNWGNKTFLFSSNELSQSPFYRPFQHPPSWLKWLNPNDIGKHGSLRYKREMPTSVPPHWNSWVNFSITGPRNCMVRVFRCWEDWVVRVHGRDMIPLRRVGMRFLR